MAGQDEKGVIIFDAKRPHQVDIIKTPEKIRKLDRLNETMFLARTFSDESYIISMKSKSIIKQVVLDIPIDLPRQSIIADPEAAHIFYAGKDSEKDKIYVYDLSVTRPDRKLFYTIPSTDINMEHPISGAIKMCINPDMQLFIQHTLTTLILIELLGMGLYHVCL